MEVTCLDVSNPLSNAVLAIHAGSVRRQAKLELNSPFIIPQPSSQSGPVEVSLFQQLASGSLPQADEAKPEVFCNIPFRKSDGDASEVQLRIRRGDAISASDGTKDTTKDSIGLTREYLDHHQLQQRIQSLIQDVLREQPENPYKYMVEQLRKVQAEKAKNEEANKPKSQAAEGQADAPTQPMAPRPPSQPKPSKTGRNLQAQTKSLDPKPPSKPSAPQDAASRSEAQAAARYSMSMVLRGKPCLAAAEYSLRMAERTQVASAMSAGILGSVKEKLVQQASQANNSQTLARASVSLAMKGASIFLKPEYHRAVTRWACHLAFRGAATKMGLKRQSESGSRRISIPTPIVFLESERSSWSQWCK